MSTPDLTPAQYGSVVAALAAVLGVVYQAPERLQVTLLVVLGAVAVALIISDAVIRHGRSGAVAAQHNLAATQIANHPVEGDDSKVPAAPAA